MKRRQHTLEQIIRKLGEAEQLLGEGKNAAEVARTLRISENAFHRWRNEYRGMKAADVKRLKELEPGSAWRRGPMAQVVLGGLTLELAGLVELQRPEVGGGLS